MKNKIIITALFIVFNLCVQAQDKYQYMIIEYRAFTTTLFVSIDDATFTKENIEMSKEERDPLNSSPLLKRVKEYQEKGWEVMSFNHVPLFLGYSAFLRKKIETK